MSIARARLYGFLYNYPLLSSSPRDVNQASHNTNHMISQTNACKCITPRLLFCSFRKLPRRSILASCPPLSKVLQIRPCSYSEHELPAGVRHNRELLLPTSINPTTEEIFQLFQQCLGSDDLVPPSATLEPVHSLLDWVAVLDFAFLEELLKMRNADVAEQGAVCL
jgi:hypothetical protein